MTGPETKIYDCIRSQALSQTVPPLFMCLNSFNRVRALFPTCNPTEINILPVRGCQRGGGWEVGGGGWGVGGGGFGVVGSITLHCSPLSI